MTMPVRIQRKRAKGFSLQGASPNGLPVVYVGRGSRWGNPFVVGAPCGVFPVGMGRFGQAETLIAALSLEQALKFYRDVLRGFVSPEMYPFGHEMQERLNHYSPRHQLRGANLACWCPLSSACHADILLELAAA